MKISEKYRAKALACEKLGRDATDFDIKCAWADIAIEWHTLANRVAADASMDGDVETVGSVPV